MKIMELKMENGQNTKTNPWIVETLDVYLHYCCPECDHKTKTKTLFVKHVFSTHPDAKDNLKFAELPVEEIVIKSDIAIKQEVLEPPDQDHNEDDSEFYDQNLEFYNQNAEWYEPEDFDLTEKSIKRERGRPLKRQFEEGDYEDEWTLQAPKKKKKKLVTIKKDPENNKFMCEICEVTFSRKKDLKDHKISVHDEKNPFGCNLCDYSCRQRGNLNRHMITAHTDKTPFECEKCDAKYKFKSALEYHLKAFHEVTIEEDIEGPVQCYRCAEIFENVLLVKEHLSAKHGICRKSHFGKPRSHQCDACKFMFENEERKDNHYCRYTLNDENVEWGKNHCKTCDMKFETRDSLLQHNRSYHVTEKKFHCDKCDFKTKTAKNLTIHKQRRHEGVKTEVCHICGSSFFDKVGLSIHMNGVHVEGKGTKEKEMICDKCGSIFNCISTLRSHVRDKHPVYYLCAFCDKKMFLATKKLRVHLINEHAVKCGKKDLHVCWKCKKCFSSFKELDEHLIGKHEFVKDKHRCQLCQDVMFSSKITLKMHVLEFHDIDFSKASNTPFIRNLFNIITEPNVQTMPGSGIPCPSCDRKFSSSRSLSDHRRQVHEKANHIKCPHCDYTTFQPYMLKRHIQRQHDKSTKYECDQCSWSTYDWGAVKVHKRKKHTDLVSFQCAECDSNFGKKRDYSLHLLQSHNIVYQWN